MLLKHLRNICLMSSGFPVAPFPNLTKRGLEVSPWSLEEGTTGLTLQKLNLRRSVLGAFTTSSMLYCFESTGPRIISSFSQEMG